MTLQTAITAEQLLEMGDIGRCELIEGEIKMMAPAGAEHGRIIVRLTSRIDAHVTRHHLGAVYAAETGFTIARNPDTTRAPDIAFVRKDRLPREVVKGYFPGAPDLAVEVLSPGDRTPEVLEKAHVWLAAGTMSVWVVDALRHTITIYRGRDAAIVYRACDEVRDEPALPGFVMPLGELFESDENLEGK
ncbi:MAG TPA: Uma2 family endonuclease [Tepidisphaeraceae bacterium]|nr:Uma2 family endonuclease [Tepidisphaeraceae bacterium]